MTANFAVGNRVWHAKHGVGEVVEVVPLSGQIVVKFEGETKVCRGKTAPVARINENLDIQAIMDELLGLDLFGTFGELDEFTASRKRYSLQEKGSGRPKGYAPWNPQKRTKIILAQIEEVLREYRAQLPLTGRQIFYRLAGVYGYPKNENAAERLSNYLVRARRARKIAFDDIRDDGASVMQERHYNGEEAFYTEIRELGQRYERDKLANQNKDIRVYCEAAGMMPQLRREPSATPCPSIRARDSTRSL